MFLILAVIFLILGQPWLALFSLMISVFIGYKANKKPH